MAAAHGLIASPSMPIILNVRDLAEDELVRLAERRGVGKRRLKGIRTVHHKVARMMAMGCSNVEVSASLGFHPARLSVLRSDPAFQELLAFYEDQEKDIWTDVREKAAELGVTATEVLHDRILEQPDAIKTDTLLALMKGGLDYGGYKPVDRREGVVLHTSPEEMERIKAGRRENVSVRESGAGREDDVAAGEIIDTEYSEAEGAVVREESTGEDRESGRKAGEEPLDSLLGQLG